MKPVIAIEPGDTVVVQSVSGSAEEVPTEERFTVRPALRAIHAAARDLGPHILTGPTAEMLGGMQPVL